MSNKTLNGVKREHLAEIDTVKGVSILFIVMIHSFFHHPVDIPEHLPMLKYISESFALCMFFMVSGFLYHHDQTPIREFFRKKVSRLLYPFLFFATVDVLLRYIFSSITYNPQNGNLLIGVWKIATGQVYWFLYSMFLILLVNRICWKFRWWIGGACLLVSLLGMKSVPEFTISKSIYYNVWFCLGYWLNSHYASMKNFALKNYLWLLIIAFCGYSCTLMIRERLVSQFALQLFGCGLVWLLCLKLSVSKVLLHLGKYSMQYYTIHLLICFVFYYLGAWVYGLTSSCIFAYISVYFPLLFTTWIGLLIEKKIKFMYPVWGL